MKSEKFNCHCNPISYCVLVFLSLSSLLFCTENILPSSVSFFLINSSNVVPQQYSFNFDEALILKMEEHIQSLIAVDIEISQSKTGPISFTIYSLEDVPRNGDKTYKVQEIAKEEVQRKNNAFRIAYDEKLDCAQHTTVKLLSCTISEKTSPLLFMFSPASSKANRQNKLTVKVKPILQDLGGIRFNLIYPSNMVYFPSIPKDEEAEAKKNIAVRIDDKHITDFSKPYMTLLGEHKVQVDSHFYKSEVITCIVAKGKIELIDIELKPLSPFITVEGPSNVDVFLDDIAIRLPFSANVATGEHILRFKMEGYEAMRNIMAEQGKKYLINLSLEINIIER